MIYCRICGKPAFVEDGGVWFCKECAMTPEEQAFIEEDNRLDTLAVNDASYKGTVLVREIWDIEFETKHPMSRLVKLGSLLKRYHIYIEASDGSLEPVKL